MARDKSVPKAGKPGRVTGTHTNSTYRKQAEDALPSTNRQLNDVIELLPDASTAIHRDRIFITWNRAVEEMAEVRAEDIPQVNEKVRETPRIVQKAQGLFLIMALSPSLVSALPGHLSSMSVLAFR